MTNRLTALRGARADDPSAGLIALEALGTGRPVVLCDEANGLGYLMQAAEHASVEFVALAATYGSGALRVTATNERLERLGIPTFGAARHLAPVDLQVEPTEGIHRHRAATLRAFAGEATKPGDLAAPGHVFSSAAGDCRTLDTTCVERAMIEAMSQAGLQPVAAYTQLVDEQGFTADRMATARLARRLGLPQISVRDVLIRREQLTAAVERLVETMIPTPEGPLNAVGYCGNRSGDEYVAFVIGPVSDGIRVDIHRRCTVSDVFGGAPCGCGEQLRAALTEMRHTGSGVVIYHGSAEDLLCTERDATRREAGWAKTVEVSAIVQNLGAHRVFLSTNERFDHRDLADLGLTVIEPSGVDWFGTRPASLVAGL